MNARFFCRSAPVALIAAFALAGPAPGRTADTPLPNAGFEDGTAGWRIEDTMSAVTNAAAHDGALGLRIVDASASDGSSVRSDRLPIEPEHAVSLTFRARTREKFLGVYFWFYSPDGKMVKDPSARDAWGVAGCTVDRTDGEWHDYTLSTVAPAGAASVAVWIHSWSTATGTADCDDFVLAGPAPDAKPLAENPPAPRTAAAAPPADLPPRAQPPLIVLKLDDLHPGAGAVPAPWVRVDGFLAQRNLKAGYGTLCSTLAEATPDWVRWMRERRDAGRVEFWFHGWDHKSHEAGGKKYNEFCGRTGAEQVERFVRSQEAARTKLGFVFTTFGPPGGIYGPSFDAGTVRAMADEPHMAAWLYPQPADDAARTLDAAGKVTVLDRVWDVNLERKDGLPDFAWCVTGYAKHPDRAYFVLQGHPMMWGTGDRFEQFARIVDFLVGQKAVFLTPSELAARLAAAP